MVRSAATPAASGEVTISRSSNGNTRLAIRVRHLAPPWRVASGTGTYVAWVMPLEVAAPNNPPEATGNPAGAQPPVGTQALAGAQAPTTTEQARASAPINVGAIRLDSNLEGKLDTVTPLRQFQLTITPEPDASVQRPTNPPVLTATLQ